MAELDSKKKEALDRRFVLLFETAKRSLLAADRLFQQVASDLRGFETDLDARVDIGERAIAPMLAAVAFVDFAFRFGGAIANLPYLRKDTVELKRLEAALKPIGDSRHHLQHMREDLSQLESIDFPILGALCWTHERTSYSVWFSQPGSASVPSAVFDRFEKRWVSTFTFIVKHVSIDLETALQAMHSTYDWICQNFSATDPSIMELKWGTTLSFATRVEIGRADSAISKPETDNA